MKRANSVDNRSSRHAQRSHHSQSPISLHSNSNILEQSEFERIESLHIECHEIEHELKSLTMKMSDVLAKQTSRKVDDKDSQHGPAVLYDNLRETLRKFQALIGGWDQLFQQISDQKSVLRLRYEKEIEDLKRTFQYQLKSVEYQHKTLMQEYRQDFSKREQEVYGAIDFFSNGLSNYARNWDGSIKDLEFLKEQAEHVQTSLLDQQNATVEDLEERVSRIFDELVLPSDSKPSMDIRRMQAFEQHRENIRVAGGNPPLSGRSIPDILKNVSPAYRNRLHNPKLNRCDELDYQKSSRDEHHIPLSKRTVSSKGHFDESSVTSSKFIEELKLINQNNGNVTTENVENSRISMAKNEGEWDSTLEDESSDNLIEIGKAFEILNRNRVFEPDNLEKLNQCIFLSKEHDDRLMWLEVFLQCLKTKNGNIVRDTTPNGKNNDMPLYRQPKQSTSFLTGGETLTTNTKISAEFPKRHLKELNTNNEDMHDLGKENSELACTTPSNQRFMFPLEGDEKLNKTISQYETSRLNSNKSKENKPHIVNLVDSKKKSKKKDPPSKRRDINMEDLLGVKSDMSFFIMSPSGANCEEKENVAETREMHHVRLEDILGAPSEIEEWAAAKDVPNKINRKGPLKSERRMNHQEELLKQGLQQDKRACHSNPTTFRNYGNAPVVAHLQPNVINQSKIKIIEEQQNLASVIKHGGDSNTGDSSQRKKLQELYRDDEKLDSDRILKDIENLPSNHHQGYDKAELAKHRQNEIAKHRPLERLMGEQKNLGFVRRNSPSPSPSIGQSESSNEHEFLGTPGKHQQQSYIDQSIEIVGIPSDEKVQPSFRRRSQDLKRKQVKGGPLKVAASLSCENRYSPSDAEQFGFLANDNKSIQTNNSIIATKKLTKNKIMTNNSLRSFFNNYTENDTAAGYNVNFVAFSERSEPLIYPSNMLNMFSNIVETEESPSSDFLNWSFPPARANFSANKFEVRIPRKQQANGSLLKGMETADTANGLRNFTTNTNTTYNQHTVTGVKDVKTLTSMNSFSFNASKLTNPSFTKSRINN